MSSQQEQLKSFLQAHIERRPRIQVTDVYKLLFQGVFGVGHLMGEKAKDYLREEATRINLDDHIWEPLTEPVSPDNSMIRVNLRPFLREKMSLEKLFQVMVESSKRKGREEQFHLRWKWFKKLLPQFNTVFKIDSINEIDSAIKTDGVKPRHHSQEYREAYYPAYRVVVRGLFDEIFKA